MGRILRNPVNPVYFSFCCRLFADSFRNLRVNFATPSFSSNSRFSRSKSSGVSTSRHSGSRTRFSSASLARSIVASITPPAPHGMSSKNSHLEFAHPDQEIPAVPGRAVDHVVVGFETFEGVEHGFARQRRAVGADDDHGLEAEREKVGKTVSQPFAQVFAALRDHQGALTLDLFKSLLFTFGRVAEREAECLALL